MDYIKWVKSSNTNTTTTTIIINFGYEAFVHIDKENTTKLETKSKKCIFIGYEVDDFGYCLWDYENHKIIRSRDVVFNENVMYKY